MHKRKCNGQVDYKMREGFSLVEVIIAVVLLALLVVPIMVYFTNAAVYSSEGKNTQKANLSAQTVVEEINAYPTVDDLEKDATAGTDADINATSWTMTQSSSYDPTTHQYRPTILKKFVNIDGNNYRAVAKLDYGNVDSSTGNSQYYNSAKADQYNKFNEPKLSEVYSPNNVVFSETSDQEDMAASDFMISTKDDTATIKNNMTRKIKLHIDDSDTSTSVTVYHVSVDYIYTYKSKTCTVSLGDTKIQKDKLEKIYLFFDVPEKLAAAGSTTEGAEEFETEFNLSETLSEKFSIYLICQRELPKDSVTGNSNVRLNLDGTGSPNYNLVFGGTAATYMSCYANVKTNFSGTTLALTGNKYSDTDTIKRIANVDVDVYAIEDTSESNSLVHLGTVKGD